MLNADFYNFTQQVQGALYSALFAGQNKLREPLPPLPPMFQIRAGYAESPGWFMVQALEFDPEPLTVANLRVRDIYASERIVAALLELLAGEQWLRRQGEAYHLTDAGRDTLNQVRSRTLKLLEVMETPLPAEQLNRLESLLSRVIDSSLGAGDPPGNWCLAHSRNRAPDNDAPPLLKLNQYFSDLNAFRDDAHMAAWKACDVGGYAWEAFTLICDGQAGTADDVYDKLPFRGYSVAEYEKALQTMLERGWLDHPSVQAGQYRITEAGQAIRNNVETLTDEYFYKPWSSLSPNDLEETQQLLNLLHDRSQSMAN